MKKAGLDINKVFYWEDEIIIRLADGKKGAEALKPKWSGCWPVPWG